MDILENPVSIKDNEHVVKSFHKEHFIGELCQTFKKQIIRNLHKLFQKRKQQRILLTHSRLAVTTTLDNDIIGNEDDLINNKHTQKKVFDKIKSK